MVAAIRYTITMCPVILIDRQLLDIKYLKSFSFVLFVATNQISQEKNHNRPLKIRIQYAVGVFHSLCFFGLCNKTLWELIFTVVVIVFYDYGRLKGVFNRSA